MVSQLEAHSKLESSPISHSSSHAEDSDSAFSPLSSTSNSSLSFVTGRLCFQAQSSAPSLCHCESDVFECHGGHGMQLVCLLDQQVHPDLHGGRCAHVWARSLSSRLVSCCGVMVSIDAFFGCIMVFHRDFTEHKNSNPRGLRG